jgi:hypothetical protein
VCLHGLLALQGLAVGRSAREACVLRVGPSRTPAGVPAQIIAGAWGKGLRSIVLCTSTRGGYLRTTGYLVFQSVQYLACTLGLQRVLGARGGVDAKHGLPRRMSQW